MNTAELTNHLAKKLTLPKSEVTKRMEDFVEILTDELAKGNTLAITSFGTFEVKKRDERISVHPSTQNKILIPPKLIVKFKPAITFKDKIKMLKP